jgi:uncharacterized linocin/CFP29 family protein
LPLVEVRIPFTLNQMEIDMITRGSKDPDLRSLEEVAIKAGRFEDSAIYRGLPPAQIEGILPSSSRKTVSLPGEPNAYPAAVAEGLKEFTSRGIPGPYVLVLGTTPFLTLMQRGERGYPPHRIIREMIDGKVLSTPVLDGGVLLSTASGHFELTIGQDWSIGYASHDRDAVELYLTESFTFRVLEPAAAIELKAGS